MVSWLMGMKKFSLLSPSSYDFAMVLGLSGNGAVLNLQLCSYGFVMVWWQLGNEKCSTNWDVSML